MKLIEAAIEVMDLDNTRKLIDEITDSAEKLEAITELTRAMALLAIASKLDGGTLDLGNLADAHSEAPAETKEKKKETKKNKNSKKTSKKQQEEESEEEQLIVDDAQEDESEVPFEDENQENNEEESNEEGVDEEEEVYQILEIQDDHTIEYLVAFDEGEELENAEWFVELIEAEDFGVPYANEKVAKLSENAITSIEELTTENFMTFIDVLIKEVTAEMEQ